MEGKTETFEQGSFCQEYQGESECWSIFDGHLLVILVFNQRSGALG
jgi:hypothetical protein